MNPKKRKTKLPNNNKSKIIVLCTIAFIAIMSTASYIMLSKQNSIPEIDFTNHFQEGQQVSFSNHFFSRKEGDKTEFYLFEEGNQGVYIKLEKDPSHSNSSHIVINYFMSTASTKKDGTYELTLELGMTGPCNRFEEHELSVQLTEPSLVSKLHFQKSEEVILFTFNPETKNLQEFHNPQHNYALNQDKKQTISILESCSAWIKSFEKDRGSVAIDP